MKVLPAHSDLAKHINHYWVVQDAAEWFMNQPYLYAFPGITPEIIIVLDGQLSSHLLSEVEKVASKVGILREGELAFEGSLSELQNLRSKQLQLRLRVSSPDRLPTHFPDLKMEQDGQTFRLTIKSEDDIPGILQPLMAAGHDIYEATPQSGALEDLFMQITKNSVPNETS